MHRSLSDLADDAGIETTYISESGEVRVITDEVKQALLALLRMPESETAQMIDTPVGAEPCFVPRWLRDSRAWGIAVQLYGVRSQRNCGIGDFEDLARLAELLAPFGADFIGVSPLHALFMADPDRASPYSPSSKQFLNPIYIAVDRVVRETDLLALGDKLQQLRDLNFVDYAEVAAVKRGLLETAFARRSDDPAFVSFCAAGATALNRFAIFEALSEHFAAKGLGAGWHSWPREFHDPASECVTEFAAAHARRVDFHKWLQWVASEQLAHAQNRACAAGMRIGVYLDLAVGVSPDGSSAWSDKELYATGARVGAPPDMFNHLGQDWGLTPMRPTTVQARQFEPLELEVSAAMKMAGAVRLDHAMGLTRLYWLPAGADARSGGYVRYPVDAMLSVLGRSSKAHRCMVIGEDLGTVPPGFRDKMQAHQILSYRVLYFERSADGMFIRPQGYPKEALACVATHDLAPLHGWWCGSDIDERANCLRYECEADVVEARAQRAMDRQKLVESLAREQLLDASAVDHQSSRMAEEVFTAVHVYLARSPAWLFGVQLEDIAGSTEMVNLPGTDKQRANWRRKIPIAIEELPQRPLPKRTLEAIAAERPRRP